MWQCTNCETVNDSDTCVVCGASKPETTPQPVEVASPANSVAPVEKKQNIGLITVLIAVGVFVVVLLALVITQRVNDGSGTAPANNVSSEAQSVEENNEELLLGEWKSEIDMGDIMDEVSKAEVEAMDEETKALTEAMDFGNLSMNLVCEFKNNGKYSMKFDKDSIDEFKEDLIKAMHDPIVEMLEKELEAKGLDISAEEALEMQGMSLDELLSEALKEMNFDEIDFDQDGFYKLVDDRLYTADDKDSLEDVICEEYEYIEVKFTNDGFEFTDYYSEDESEESKMFKMMLPLKFEAK